MALIDLLQQSNTAFAVFGLLLGLMIGSFLNVVIHRLPRMLETDWHAQCAELHNQPAPVTERYNLIVPRSACPVCGHRITALENIPIISYLALRGRCSGCDTRISPRYPLVELLTGLALGYCAWRYGFGMAAVGAMLFLCCMVALTGIDIDTLLLPDDITLFLLWAGLLFNVFGVFTDLQSAVIGAAAGYLSLWLVFWGFKFATGKEGMGYGDFKLLAAIGAWLGWQMLPVVILLSSAVGAVVGIAILTMQRAGRDLKLPFGPYLAGAGVIALWWGKDLVDAYLRFAVQR